MPKKLSIPSESIPTTHPLEDETDKTLDVSLQELVISSKGGSTDSTGGSLVSEQESKIKNMF